MAETLARAFMKLDCFKGGSFINWLKKVLCNVNHTEVRRNKMKNGHEGRIRHFVTFNFGIKHEIDLDLEIDTKEAASKINPSHRRIFDLIRTDHTYGDIARIEGIPPGTVMSRIYRARQSIQQNLQGCND